jgi:hypothetical protein
LTLSTATIWTPCRSGSSWGNSSASRSSYDAHESFPDMLEGNVPSTVRSGLTRLENFLIRGSTS